MKKSMKKYMQSGMKLTAGSIAIGSMPTMGNAGAQAVKTNVGSGMVNFSKSYPAVGKMMGAGYVIKSSKGLMNTTKKLKKKY